MWAILVFFCATLVTTAVDSSKAHKVRHLANTFSCIHMAVFDSLISTLDSLPLA
jgi:hypothetical protein